MDMQQLTYQEIWTDLLKVQKELYSVKERKEFEWESIKAHWDLRNPEEALKALNSLLFLLNREKIARQKIQFKRQVHKAMEKDWYFTENLPYNEGQGKKKF